MRCQPSKRKGQLTIRSLFPAGLFDGVLSSSAVVSEPPFGILLRGWRAVRCRWILFLRRVLGSLVRLIALGNGSRAALVLLRHDFLLHFWDSYTHGIIGKCCAKHVMAWPAGEVILRQNRTLRFGALALHPGMNSDHSS